MDSDGYVSAKLLHFSYETYTFTREASREEPEPEIPGKSYKTQTREVQLRFRSARLKLESLKLDRLFFVDQMLL